MATKDFRSPLAPELEKVAQEFKRNMRGSCGGGECLICAATLADTREQVWAVFELGKAAGIATHMNFAQEPPTEGPTTTDTAAVVNWDRGVL